MPRLIVRPTSTLAAASSSFTSARRSALSIGESRDPGQYAGVEICEASLRLHVLTAPIHVSARYPKQIDRLVPLGSLASDGEDPRSHRVQLIFQPISALAARRGQYAVPPLCGLTFITQGYRGKLGCDAVRRKRAHRRMGRPSWRFFRQYRLRGRPAGTQDPLPSLRGSSQSRLAHPVNVFLRIP
ncbi:hypothetical protein DAEQUDRAFT_440934 [Daedalea quercina L-15889]|uniref:Uncharacterized protein n=1 Tax=Daedalea quercina L-15889 TaxID=1314783 RepID=A0A165NC62_9APHY|nr:hypothetical protein DAEQUDRAFT_440934 [Daedalea quercina L-15889]